MPQASACAAMPAFLDYVYGSVELATDSSNAVALMALANYFCNPAVFEQALEFIRRDLTVETAVQYLIETGELCLYAFATLDA